MTDIRKQIADLSSERRALLDRLLKEKGIDITQSVILPSSREGNRFPLSYAQRRLWFLAQLDPESSVYTVPAAFRLSGRIHVENIQRCIDTIVRRHESLRTVFAAVEGVPVQIVRNEMPVPVEIITLPADTAGDQEAAAHREAMLVLSRPFDLSNGPLIRVSAIPLQEQEHLLVFAMHHIISDGWSMGVLAREFLALYHALRRGIPASLPPLVIQYPDFAVWQQAWAQSPGVQEHLAYWKQQLADLPPLLTLPVDYHRPHVLGSQGAYVEHRLPRTLVDALHTLSHSENATLFMVLLAGMHGLLVRYTGNTDIIIGTPVANRNRPETEPLVGFFVNTLVLRTNAGGNPTFRELLRRVRQTSLEAYAHQDLPFEKVVEELNPRRILSQTPLFQLMVAFQNIPSQEELSGEGLRISPVRVHTGTSAFDVTLLAAELPEGLGILAEYNTQLYEGSTIGRFLQRLTTFLEGAVNDPDALISDIPCMFEREKHRLLVEWNSTEEVLPAQTCVHNLIDDQARATPDAIAVASRTGRMTYRELAGRSDAVAHALRSRGAGPEMRVGVCIERSPELIVALLGILKSGSAFVPLDPDSPEERLRFIIRDAGIGILLADSKHENLTDLEGVQRVSLEDAYDGPGADGPRERLPAVLPENTMYLLYTSGSTGTPKGVMVTHGAVINHHFSVRKIFSLSRADRVLQFSSVNFDASFEEIFPVLTVGGTVVLRDPGPSIAAHDLRLLVAQEGVTILEFPTAYWHEWVQILARDREIIPDSVRLVVIGGEQVSRQRLAEWQQLPGRLPALVNMYGPTETTIASTWHLLSENPGEEIRATAPGIGKPLANTRVYLLDSSLAPVPIGAYGDLYIGGVGLARGYNVRPELTAEKFLPDPFGSSGGERLYRTGDRARFRPDGVLEFAGRSDAQLKVRGFLVEPAEVEEVMSRHPRIREVCVFGRERGGAGLTLAAFYVPDAEADAFDAEDVQSWARRFLPEYMVPTVCIRMEQLPKSPSGKIDRSALAQVRLDRNDERQTVLPGTPTESLIAGFWKELLAIDDVSAHDHFFESGGHSLVATQLVARLRSALGVEVPVRTVFEYPTLREMSAAIDRARESREKSEELPIVSVSREEPLELSFAQQRLWFLDQLDPGNSVYNTPLAVRFEGELDISVLERSLQEIVRRHEVLRTTFEVHEGRPVQRIHPSLPLEIEQVDLQNQPEDSRLGEAVQLLSGEAGRPFDLLRGPLVRTILYRLSPGDHVLFIGAHHIVADGWSLGILAREMIELYGAHTLGRAPALPALQVQYADYAAWQRLRLRGEVLGPQLAYWKGALAESDPILQLPVDRARPVMQTSRGGHHKFLLSADLGSRLDHVCRAEGVTLFMALLAGFATVLHRYSSQTNFIVGTPTANRTRAELENLVGFFVNVLPLPVDFAGDPTFRETLRRIRRTALDAYAHEETPFEKIVDALHLPRDTSRTPLFQVMFVFQNAPSPHLDVPGLRASAVPVHHDVAMYDLTLSCEATPEGIAGDWEFNADLFDRSSIERMSRQLALLLDAALVQLDTPVSLLPLGSQHELLHQVKSWNDTRVPLADASCVHDRIDARAREIPEGIAVELGQMRLTYSELSQRSNQLANELLTRGAGAESRVGIGMGRSPDLIAGLLGILKTGAAYVPLDPSYPDSRLQDMCADARISLIVSDSLHANRFSGYRAEVIVLEEVLSGHASHPRSSPAPQADSANLAYVVYTSGSTGAPKGVMVSHGSLLNHNLAVVKDFRLTPDDRVLQFASPTFDASAEEIFPALLVGATLVMKPDEILPTGAEFLRFTEEERITVVDLPTTYWNQWTRELSDLNGKLPPTLRLVVVGGDRVSIHRFSAWRKVAPPAVRWLNTYGPTEGTIIATLFDASERKAECEARGEVPIGVPIANVRTYVLDKHLGPVPTMVSGELCIAGAGVARGYLNRPDLTAECFVPDPYGDEPGARMYRTGDRARSRPDGVLEFLGRQDNQVKVRGYRVELDEIEHALLGHPLVSEAAVLVREGQTGELRIAAYCVLKGGAQLSGTELRAFLGTVLPDFMIPSIISILSAIPKTSSGKIDRRALPEQDDVRAEIGTLYIGPRTDTETSLVEIWEKVLGLGRIGVRDNFFELGGDSIQTIQIVAKARQAGLLITPRDLFEHPTIERLASAAGRKPPVTAEQGVVTGTAPLTPIQRWFFGLNLRNHHHWNQTVLLDWHDPLPPEVLERALNQLMLHHDALRLRFETTAGGWQQRYTEPESAPVVVTEDLSRLSAEDRQARLTAVAEEAQRSLNITAGPLLRVIRFDYGPEEAARLLVVIHHLIIDVVSWNILLEDLVLCLQASMQGRELQLPQKTTSFKEWARRLIDYAQSPDVEGAKQYWLKSLVEPPIPVPVDIPQGSNIEARSEQITVVLGKEETAKLLREIPAAYGTEMPDVLLTALARTLMPWIGTRSLLIELESHGREPLFEDIDLSRTVGWFTTLFPLRLDFRSIQGTQEALRYVKEEIRRVPHHGFEFLLLSHLSPEGQMREHLRAMPHPQIAFNYLGQVDQPFQESGWFTLARDPSGYPFDPESERRHLLEINAAISGGELHVEWNFSGASHHRSTIETLCGRYLEELRIIIQHCQAHDTGGYSPSDFGLAGVDQEQLDLVLRNIGRPAKGS